MLRSRVLEVDANLVDLGGRLGVLLLDGGHDQRRAAVGAEDEGDRTLSRDVVEPCEVGHARGVEDADGVETGRINPGAHALTTQGVLGLRYRRNGRGPGFFSTRQAGESP